MTILFGVFLLTLMVITALAIVHAHHLFVAVILTSIYSLLMALTFFLLDAADVALTEAAVGAGISTVLFLGALSLTDEYEHLGTSNRVLGIGIVTVITLIVIYATFDKPRLGDIDAPVHQHVAPWYLEQTSSAIDIPNVVTAILASFRGYDTLGEVFVVFTAGIGVLFLFAARASLKPEASRSATDPETSRGLRHYLIPRVIGRLVIPFILLFGLYVQFHGEHGPGGGFQAGAIIAAAFILFSLLEGEARAQHVFSQLTLIRMIAGGALLYGAVGVAGLLLGGNFLEYSVLAPNPVTGQHIGILLIEAGVGITVAGVLISVYQAFSVRGKF